MGWCRGRSVMGSYNRVGIGIRQYTIWISVFIEDSFHEVQSWGKCDGHSSLPGPLWRPELKGQPGAWLSSSFELPGCVTTSRPGLHSALWFGGNKGVSLPSLTLLIRATEIPPGGLVREPSTGDIACKRNWGTVTPEPLQEWLRHKCRACAWLSWSSHRI